jgi:exonuclease SbcD
MYPDMIPEQIQYTALGHLHRYIEVRKAPPVVYSSSPLSYSFSEAEQQKYVVLIDAEPGEPVLHQRIPLQQGRPLLRIKANGVDDAVEQLSSRQEAMIELTLRSDTYLSAGDRRRLREAHPDIITLVPDVQFNSEDSESHSARESIDLDKSLDELFADYFISQKQQPPGEELMQLFQEIKARRDGESAGEQATTEDNSTL